MAQIVETGVTERKRSASWLEVVLIQARGTHRLNPIEDIAIPSAWKQRRVRVILAGVSGLAAERVNVGEVVPQLVGKP